MGVMLNIVEYAWILDDLNLSTYMRASIVRNQLEEGHRLPLRSYLSLNPGLGSPCDLEAQGQDLTGHQRLQLKSAAFCQQI